MPSHRPGRKSSYAGEQSSAHATARHRPRLHALSGIRFFAIAYVVMFHLGDAAFEDLPAFLDRCRRQANVVMPLFFVLSGFVLAYNYREPIASGRLGVREFYVSRLLRLWPIYVVALLLRFSIDASVHRGVPTDYVAGTLAQLLMIQGFTPPLAWFGNAPGWTVSVEAFLYVLFPWLVVALSRVRLRRALLVAAALWAGGQCASFAYVRLRPDGWPPPGPPNEYFLDLLRFLPPLHLPSFVIGIVAARIFTADLDRGIRRRAALLTLAGAAPVAFTIAGGLQYLGRLGVEVLAWPFPFTHNGLLAPAWALVVYGLAHGGFGATALSAKPLVRLGEASYGLYILHFPLFDAVTLWLVPDWDRTPLFLLQIFALLLPISVVSHERFEQPLRRALLERWRARFGGEASSAPSHSLRDWTSAP